MKATRAESLIPIVSGLLLAALLVFAGRQFVVTTKARTLQTRNQIITTHNKIAKLPQPINIDLGVPSGSIMGQSELYKRAVNSYEDLSFNQPSALRQRIAGWLKFDHLAMPPQHPAALANEYTSFVRMQSELLSILEKPLIYDSAFDLHEIDTNSEEFKQRITNAKKGLQAARTRLNDLSLPTETRKMLDQELAAWSTASETLPADKKLAVWDKQVKTSQKAIRHIMQEYWTNSISSLSQDKQALITYYSQFYQ